MSSQLTSEKVEAQKESAPIEKDPRFIKLVKDYKYRLQEAKAASAGLLAVVFSLVTGPLHTIAISMQLSVIPHLTIYGDVAPDQVKKGFARGTIERVGLLLGRGASAETALAELSKEQNRIVELTRQLQKTGPLAELKAGELMVASGQVGLNKPYRAPIYQTYSECVRGLHRQGILGFYKGNACRCAHWLTYDLLRTRIQYMCDTDDSLFKRHSFFIDLAAACAASLFLHPLHFAEARFVLNNRLPNFSAYKSIYSLGISSFGQATRGATLHFPRSFIMAFSGFNYFSSANMQTFVATHLAFHTLAYPLLTVQRRLECQSGDRPGMIPSRYMGPVHATGLMLREEGFRGLYRGYTAYLLATAFYWAVVPLLAEFSVTRSAIGGHYYDDTDDLFDQVQAGRRQ